MDNSPSSSFMAHLQSNLQGFRERKEFCDFTIIVADDKYHVHKVILAASSNYFRAMLSHNSIESQNNEVSILNISSNAIKLLLDFIYTSKIQLDNDNVQEILFAANIIQLDQVQESCIKYITNNIDIFNCLGVLVTADKCNLTKLSEIALSYCLDNFELIIEESDFLDIDEGVLIRIISNSELNVGKEEEVFQAIIKWINAEPNERVDKIELLMPHVRLSLVEPIPLIAISNHDYVKRSIKCRDLLEQAKNFRLLEKYPQEQAQLQESHKEPRKSQRRNQRIYSVGGWTNAEKPIHNVERYNPYTDIWEEVPKMFCSRCGVGVAILDNFLYAVGGHNGQIYLNSVERFNMKTELWSLDVAYMNYERTSVGVVELGGYIYAIGGQGTSGPLDVVEKYNPKTNEWQECPSMNSKRLGAGVTVLDGEIIVVGGSDQEGVFADAECYRPGDDKWRIMGPNMNKKRKHLGCTTFDGKIYAVGGRDEVSELNTAECFSNGKWEYIPSMSTKRSGIGLVELDGLLYAIGGHNGDVRLNLVEAYDAVDQSWSLKKPMIYERLGGGMTVYKTLNHDRK